MNAQIQEIVNKLSKHFNFNVEEAMELLNPKSDNASETSQDSKTKLSPLEQARKNVALWQKKQDANKFKDDDAKNKHQAKLDKEKAKLAKLEASNPEVKTVAVVTTKEVKAESDKLISRMSPTIKTALLKILRENGQTISDEDWKKSKKPDEFKNYVNSLYPEHQKAKGLDKHMEDFVRMQNLLGPEVVVQKTEPSPSQPERLTITQLKSIKKLSETETPGLYWDADKGRFVTGPEENVDEDMVEFSIREQLPNASTSSTAETLYRNVGYAVGEKTKRVYLCSEDESPDVFVGYLKIGKFANVTDPTL